MQIFSDFDKKVAQILCAILAGAIIGAVVQIVRQEVQSRQFLADGLESQATFRVSSGTVLEEAPRPRGLQSRTEEELYALVQASAGRRSTRSLALRALGDFFLAEHACCVQARRVLLLYVDEWSADRQALAAIEALEEGGCTPEVRRRVRNALRWSEPK